MRIVCMRCYQDWLIRHLSFTPKIDFILETKLRSALAQLSFPDLLFFGGELAANFVTKECWISARNNSQCVRLFDTLQISKNTIGNGRCASSYKKPIEVKF